MEGKAISTSRNILCFGDSLTWGYIFCEPNPYSITLAKELKGKGFSDQIIETNGLNGDLAAKMTQRLQTALEAQQYGLCIILAGTNDLAYNFTPEQIYQNIQKLHIMCHEKGIRTIAITVPQWQYMNVKNYESTKDSRLYIRQQLMQFAAESNGRCTLYDLYQEIPYDSENMKYWSDSLHFTQEGYEKIGKDLAAIIEQNQLIRKTE